MVENMGFQYPNIDIINQDKPASEYAQVYFAKTIEIDVIPDDYPSRNDIIVKATEMYNNALRNKAEYYDPIDIREDYDDLIDDELNTYHIEDDELLDVCNDPVDFDYEIQ
jgi:hypothetical protein